LDAAPEPHDIVACTDVLEHLEPYCVDDVIDDLRRVTRKALFLTIATRVSKRTLADGRNAHLIVEGAPFWLQILWKAGFEVLQFAAFPGELQLICR